MTMMSVKTLRAEMKSELNISCVTKSYNDDPVIFVERMKMKLNVGVMMIMMIVDFFDQYHEKRELFIEISTIDSTNTIIVKRYVITIVILCSTCRDHFHQICYDHISTSRTEIILPFQTGEKPQKCCLVITRL